MISVFVCNLIILNCGFYIKSDVRIYASETVKEMTIFKKEKHWYLSHCYSDKGLTGTVVNRTRNAFEIFNSLLKGKSFFILFFIY